MTPMEKYRKHVFQRVHSEQNPFRTTYSSWIPQAITTTIVTTTTTTTTITAATDTSAILPSTTVGYSIKNTRLSSILYRLKLLQSMFFEMDGSMKISKIYMNNAITIFSLFMVLAFLCLLFISVTLALSLKQKLVLKKQGQNQSIHDINSSMTSSITMDRSSSSKKISQINTKSNHTNEIDKSNQDEPLVYYSTIPYISHYLLPKKLPTIQEMFV
ncbi:unnamed protein product [Rotaria socialis]|uniref:Uncharacterized protein n=1 Tax=Rotaria socialis TaxID=392032 RepID=A0A819WJR3_9BILA|nr:unnamed protein product [Rotaria socialis]CAF4281022.1 unnamed protein product [Rotaria socialis]CAF4477417.1 unnamed protein product [Rotaria socialis]